LNFLSKVEGKVKNTLDRQNSWLESTGKQLPVATKALNDLDTAIKEIIRAADRDNVHIKYWKIVAWLAGNLWPQGRTEPESHAMDSAIEKLV
jgi:hypothetical protein